MADREEFDHLVRDALANLYDYAALEIHPLASVLPRPHGYQGSRAEFLYHALLEAVEALRPPGKDPSTCSIEWRPYLILHDRYVKGVRLQDLESRLSLGARQLRREHGRALKAVASVLWDRAWPQMVSDTQGEAAISAQRVSGLGSYEIARAGLDLVEVMRGVASMVERRVRSEGAELRLDLPAELPQVQADRVILRQILFSLINYALQVRSSGDIRVGVEIRPGQVALSIAFQVDDPSSFAPQGELSLETASYWAQRLGAVLGYASPSEEEPGARLLLSLPRAREPVVLVVDDQEAAIRMFRRYLSQVGVHVAGIQEPDQVVPTVCQLQPSAITLDVMMPTMDGWEILQALQANPETRDVPVIVCSVWDEPELAYSLGAACFLKKPISQRDLWAALARLGLLDMLGGSPPAGT